MKILNTRQARTIVSLAVHELGKYLKENNLKTVVLGISGGLDSAVMAVLALKTIHRLDNANYPVNYIFDFIGVESHSDDLKKARLLAHETGFVLGEYDYTAWYQGSPIRLDTHARHSRLKVAMGNLKCRIRMLHLYDRAQLLDGIVLDTDDLSELHVGFWTRHGDVGDVKVIQHLTKDEVRDLGEHLGISKIILNANPGDGLGITESSLAKDQLKMDYLKTDYVISRFIQEGFEINGNLSQLTENKFTSLKKEVANEIGEKVEDVEHVLAQSLKTAYKRKYGDDVLNLLPERSNMSLSQVGSGNFNRLYLAAIRNLK